MSPSIQTSKMIDVFQQDATATTGSPSILLKLEAARTVVDPEMIQDEHDIHLAGVARFSPFYFPPATSAPASVTSGSIASAPASISSAPANLGTYTILQFPVTPVPDPAPLDNDPSSHVACKPSLWRGSLPTQVYFDPTVPLHDDELSEKYRSEFAYAQMVFPASAIIFIGKYVIIHICNPSSLTLPRAFADILFHSLPAFYTDLQLTTFVGRLMAQFGNSYVDIQRRHTATAVIPYGIVQFEVHRCVPIIPAQQIY